ncbi:MAG: AMIN domain-containing protein, partial [Planctomycetota bacterium]
MNRATGIRWMPAVAVAALAVGFPTGATETAGQSLPIAAPLRQGGGGQGEAGAVIARNGVPTPERLRGAYLNGGELYLRLSDLGNYLLARDRFDFKNKYELVVGDRELKFTLGSSAVIIDGEPENAINLPRPVRLHRGMLYAPAAGIAAVLTAFTGRQCDYVPDNEWLDYGGTGLNVLGIDLIDNPEQGTQVTILTTEPIAYEHFTQGDGVINVTLEGARADINVLKRSPRMGLVRQIEVFDHGDDVLQISFHLSRRYGDRPRFYQTPEGIVFT